MGLYAPLPDSIRSGASRVLLRLKVLERLSAQVLSALSAFPPLLAAMSAVDELTDEILGLFAEPPTSALSVVLGHVADVLREDPSLLPVVEDVVQDAHRAVRVDVPAHQHAFVAILSLPEMDNPEKVVDTWTELALQAVLKHTRLDTRTMQAAKELAVGALISSDDATYVVDYRKRMFQLYLLDAPSDTSGQDAVESAAMEDFEKESKRAWKENLGDVLIAFAMRKPKVRRSACGRAPTLMPPRTAILLHCKYSVQTFSVTTGVAHPFSAVGYVRRVGLRRVGIERAAVEHSTVADRGQLDVLLHRWPHNHRHHAAAPCSQVPRADCEPSAESACPSRACALLQRY